jgi:hypothetical protein
VEAIPAAMAPLPPLVTISVTTACRPPRNTPLMNTVPRLCHEALADAGICTRVAEKDQLTREAEGREFYPKIDTTVLNILTIRGPLH